MYDEIRKDVIDRSTKGNFDWRAINTMEEQRIVESIRYSSIGSSKVLGMEENS